jgi:hypothetical protein
MGNGDLTYGLIRVPVLKKKPYLTSAVSRLTGYASSSPLVLSK